MLAPFWDAKTMKNQLNKLCLKYVIFEAANFLVFFDFGAILGGLGSPGASQKSPKVAQDAPKIDFGEGLGHVSF